MIKIGGIKCEDEAVKAIKIRTSKWGRGFASGLGPVGASRQAQSCVPKLIATYKCS